ncbi:hypothetical protein ACTHQ4_16520 [Alkalicoccobacillus gibsonii]|uniref:hypothetical protein n=1 Tax=Alkalicoccobacillus gibsonii TaxID=79881 RepID=UPI003F7C2830
MSKLIMGSTFIVVGVLMYLGIFIVTATVLANLVNGLSPEDVLRETWLYYPKHYIAALAFIIIGILLWGWHIAESIKSSTK